MTLRRTALTAVLMRRIYWDVQTVGTHWSEEDQELIIPCLALARASKACLKKTRLSVAENGKKGQVAQLDDIVDISDEISPSVDDLALSIYPPVCPLTVRNNVSTSFEGIAADLIGRISGITGIFLNCGEYVCLLHLDASTIVMSQCVCA
uniref:Cyclin-D1-binding protein 1-like C-terminal domain-containing protein n=1 Tax=Moschus moschiferus TaxID=68415 RepID=A0A8C6D646_MOSMO